MAGSATGMGFRRIALAQGLLESQPAVVSPRSQPHSARDGGERVLAYADHPVYTDLCTNDSYPDHSAQYR